jgi:hypothetical protein
MEKAGSVSIPARKDPDISCIPCTYSGNLMDGDFNDPVRDNSVSDTRQGKLIRNEAIE